MLESLPLKFINILIKKIITDAIKNYRYNPLHDIIIDSINRAFANIPKNYDISHIKEIFLSDDILLIFKNNINNLYSLNRPLLKILERKGLDERTLPKDLNSIINFIQNCILKRIDAWKPPPKRIQLLKIFDKKYQLQIADLFMLRASTATKDIEWNVSLEDSESAFEIYNKYDNYAGKLRALDNMGKMYINIGDYKLAKEKLLEASNIIKGDISVLNRVNIRLGWINYHLNNYDDAEKYFRSMLKKSIYYYDKELEEASRHFLGKTLFRRRNISKALKFFEEAKEIKELNNTNNGHNTHWISRCYISLNDENNWEKYLDNTKDWFTSMNEIAHVYLDEGRYLIKNNYLNQAIDKFYHAEDKWKKIGYKKGLSDIYYYLGKCFESKRLYDRAINYYSLAEFNQKNIGSPLSSRLINFSKYRIRNKMGEKEFDKLCNKIENKAKKSIIKDY
ncbi:MAG: tetratricopeptide repeat protein [Candidatus Hodarchaeota archaeon]